ncbi:MAG: NAD(+) synthase, partial [Clostridia bacterium]|nr:NAD(+) synthase [Clostridia bacterium]
STRVLLDGAMDALWTYTQETKNLNTVSVVGLPLSYRGSVYNVSAVTLAGKILGFVPKEYNKCNLKFTSDVFCDANGQSGSINIQGKNIPFGTSVFECDTLKSMRISVVFGSDAYAHASLLERAAALGATLVLMPSAVPEVMGAKGALLGALEGDSRRYSLAIAYAEASVGESTGAYVFSGKRAAYECGEKRCYAEAFEDSELSYATLDLDAVEYKRHGGATGANFTCEAHSVRLPLKAEATELSAGFLPRATPLVPTEADFSERAELIISLQARGLSARLLRSYSKTCVLGISGGLDSTMALLALVRATDILGWERNRIIAVTMPCFGTTARTKSNAQLMAEALGVSVRVVDIKEAVTGHFKDIGHDSSDYNVVYENAQARERTQVLMDIANAEGGIVLGTGDLSEAALGFATYNGDHMSMYNVNASLPKTLIRALVGYFAGEYERDGNSRLAAALYDVVNTPVSPELLPLDNDNQITQKTESIVGPYELNDFFLYTHVRLGYTPRKILRVSKKVFEGVYSNDVIERYLKLFIKRFFAQQFKRSAAPEGVNIGTVSLSSAVGFNIPSDMSSAMWQALED